MKTLRELLDPEVREALEPENFFDPRLIHEEPHELEEFFVSVLPGDDRSKHPNLPELNPYLWVPYSDLAKLSRKEDLSAEDRRHIENAMRWQSS